MNLQEARKRIPELDGLSDDAALSVIQQVYYPDIDRSTLASRLGVKVAAPPAPERTWGQAIGDTAVQLAEGVNTTLGAIPSIVAPEGSMAGFFRDNAGYWRDKQSDVLKDRIAATDQRIQEAGKEGVMSQIGTAVSEYWNDPAQAARLVATNLPSMAATLGTGALAGAAAKGVAAARGLGAAGEAALAAQYGTRTAMATNAALNAGGARGEAYEDLKRAALAQGMSSEQAEQAALDGSIMPGVVGGVAGAVSGKLGLEKALLGQPGAGAGTALRRAAGSFGAELAGEQIEEVAPKLTTNYEAGEIDPARSLTDDLGRTMVETAIGAGPGAIVAGGVEGMSSPAQDAADTIRATEKVPESGALTKAVNAGVEAKAKAVEAGGLELAPLVDGAAPEAVTSNGLALVPRPGEQTPEPVDDPVRDQILALPDGARQDALRAYAVVNRTDVANGVQQYNRKLLDRLLAENKPEPEPAPEIGGVIRNFDPASPPVSPLSLAPMGEVAYDNGIDFQPDSRAELASRSAELDRLTQRAPRTRTDGVGLNLQTDPVLNYLDNLRGVNTPAARAYVRDFDAGRITPADVQQRMQAEQGLTPEQRIARAAAEAPAQVDTVAERLRSAAAEGMATPAPTDILNPSGEPFKTKMAADLAAKKTPGAAVLPVADGGFLVRPKESVNVQDVPQAPEVPQAAPVVSQPSQAQEAVGTQPAGPAAGLPAEGAGAVEAAGVEQQGPGADAGNGFKQGPKKGERYRVGVSVGTGGVTLEKRLPGGTAATFYVGKDGGLVDADDVNLVGTKDREKLWIPTTPEQASQATAILDEMGRLDLTDPKRKDAKARLKALVTATAAVEAAGVDGDAGPTWPNMTPEQRRRSTLEREIATGMTNNGGVMAKLRPSAIEKRKQQLAELPPVDVAGVEGATPTATPSATPIVEVQDNYGRTHRVRQSDLYSNADRIPTVRQNGDVVAGEEIPRSIVKDAPSVAEQPPIGKAPEAAKSVAPAGDADAIAVLIQQSIAENSIKANEKIAREQVAKGYLTQEQADADLQRIREGFANIKPNSRTQGLAKAIAEKDPRPLVGAWAKEGQGTYGNEGSMEAFRKLTGINLKRLNSADRAKAIFDWAGWSEDQVRADVEKRKAAKAEAAAAYEAKEAAERAERTEKQADKTPLRVQGKDGETTVKAYVDDLIAQGYTDIGQTQKGAVKQVLLFNPKTNSGYPMPKGILADYAKQAVEKAKASKAAQQPAEGAKSEPFEHAGLKTRPIRVKEGDQVVDRWVVQSPENAEREARSERQIGGDRIVETREQAIKTAEQEVKRYAKEKADRAEIDAQDKARRDADEAKKEANRGKTLLERRADAILDKPGKFPASAGLGLGTKREAMDKAIEQGRLVTEVMVYDTAAKKRDQDAVDAVRRAGYILGASNENIPVVKRGLEAQARLKEGKYQKPEYRVYQGSDRNGSFFEITKTEYDYVQKVKAASAGREIVDTSNDKRIGTDINGKPVYEGTEGSLKGVPYTFDERGRVRTGVAIDDGNNPPAESKPDQETKAKAEPKAENLPEGWDTLKNGYTGLPVYRFNQGAGQPFAVVTRTEIGYEVQIRHGDKQLTTGTQRGALSEVLAAAKAELGRMTQADSVTHADPGEKAEAATPAVVTDSLKKAARNEDTKPSEMRKWLVAEIDKELLQAPDRPDYDEAVKRLGEKDAISGYTGNGPLGKNNETGYVTFDVPGDGKYKVRNSVRGLLEFRKNVMASQGFKDSGQKRVKPEQNDGVQGGSGGNMAAITNMIEEGDFEAARDYAEAVGVNLDDVKVPKGERKTEWEMFRKTGFVPRLPDTRPQPAPKTAAQLDEEKRQAAEAEEKRPKDTGWNMAGTGYGGKRYIGRNITLDDGRQVVARVYENAGTYEEAEVKVDGVRKFAVTDRENAQDKADAFIKTLTSKDGDASAPVAEPPAPAGRTYLAVPFNEKDYAKRAGAKWDEGKKLWYADPVGGDGAAAGEININLKQYVPQDSTKDDRYNYYGDKALATAVALNASARDGVQYDTIKRKHPDGMMMWSVVKAGEQAKAAPAAQPSIPAGYKPAGEPFYRGGKQIQGYAPFAPGERVTMKDSAGQSGVIESLASPDDSGVFSSAVVKFDNGMEQMVQFGKLEAAAPQPKAPKLTAEQRKVLDDSLRAGAMSVEDYMKATGLTDEDVGTFQSDGLRAQAEQKARAANPYYQLTNKIQDALSDQMKSAMDAASSTPQQRKSKEERIARITRDRSTLDMLTRKFEHPFNNNYVSKLSPILKSRFNKQFEGVKTGEFAKAEFNNASYQAWAELLIEAAGKKAVADGFVEAAAAPASPQEGIAQAQANAARFEIGKSLTKEQRKQVLDSLVDVYKSKGAEREFKGQDGNGNDRYGYAHSPDLFERSDITGAMVRYYVTLPDGRIAHPTELFPDVSASDIERMVLEQEANSKSEKAFENAIKPFYKDFDSANLMAVAGQVVISKGDRFAIIPDRIGSVNQARQQGWDLAKAAAPVAKPAPAAPKANTVPLSSVIDKVNAKNGQGLTDADRVPEQKPASKTPAVDHHNATMAAVREGKATPEQFQSSFEQVVSNKAAIMAELDAMTKVQLLREGGPLVQMRYANEKKADVVDAVYREMVGEYALGESVTYSMGKGAYEAAVRKMVEATDADKLARYVTDRKAAVEEMQARRAAKAAAIENPQTLADFRELLNAKIREGMTRKEAFLTLTPQQRIQYDTLEAESTREARENRKRAQKTEVRAAGQTTAGEIVATKHTRDGYDLFVVKLADRLSKEDYSTVLASAKKLGGWYSAFRGNGAIPGFQFKDKANAEAFLALAGGDTTAAQEQVAQRRDAFEDDRSQTAVERLRAMADKLEEGAAEVEGQERKTNTARRARFASAAMASAAADKAKAQTMRNIAQAIEDGDAKFLDAVRTKSQVDMLTGIVDTAKGNELRAKYPSYADQEKRKGEPPTAETADFAEFPSYSAFRSDLATLGRQMLEVDGTKKLGQRLMSVADDVTDAYLEFAKANIQQVSQFGRGDALAEFASKDEAERAIKRSGLTGKAIVLPIKRGQNRVILSPSEAIGRGLWQGDGDKRITLTAEFGAELVEAIGRRGNKQNQLSVPWQFQNAYDRRKALSRIGIETPSEFRAALREFIGLKEQAVANRTRAMELQMVGRKADGLDFFPTSAEVADQMIEAADLTPDMAVLEPSAGMGHLADRIRQAGAEPDVIEISADRRELLEEKGYTTQAVDDFLDLKPREFYTFGDTFRAPDGAEGIMRGANGNRVRLVNQAGDMVGAGYYDRADLTGVAHNGTASGYDRIIMNPPFSNRRDAEHVRHAYSLLKPGGRIVAIMGEGVFFGQDKKAQDFREWLESVGGTSEKLPEGSFMDPSLPVNTSVNARMVVIDKPATEGGNTAMFRSIRTAKSAQAKLSQDAVEKAVASALNRVVGAPKVQVVAAPADAGIDVPPGVIPKGVTLPDGSVLIFSDSAESVLDVFQTVFHELYHRGSKVRFTSNPDYITKMLEIASKDELVQQEVNAWKNTADGKDKWAEFQERGPMTGERLANFEALAVEEALATMAEKVAMGEVRKPETVIKQMARFIAKVANAWGMNRFALWLNTRSLAESEKFIIETIGMSGGKANEFTNSVLFRSKAEDISARVGDAIKSVTVTNIKQRAGFKLTDYLGIGLQALGRRQIVDIYGDLLPLAEYNRLVQQMEADKNEGGAEADKLVTRWAKLDDEGKLADLMHDATLAQIDPAEDFVEGDDKGKYLELQRKYNLLSDGAKKVYADTRDSYKAHHAKVRSAIKERIERSEIKGERKAALLKQMDDEFFKAIKGVYFPLARFGQYAVTVKGPDGKVESVSRAETKAEAEALRNNLLTAFPRDKGFTVGRVMLSKDFIADRDAVGRGFMTELYQVLDKQDMDAAQRAELEDTLGQLYLSSLPDLSWAKHGIHRKGTPGFSQDARRAFAQNMFHGARYLAKLRYSDLMQDELTAMQRHVDDWREVEDFDQNSAQRVVDEMNKRHESLMNPKSNPLSTALTSLGFVFHLGLSPASAMVNLSQTALVAYPIMGAKWGFGKASAALLKASAEAAKGKNDITASLNADELAAYNEAVRAGTIDVTMAHDLAGIAQGEDAGVMWKIRPVMRWASFLFHHAERFNRQVTFVAAYRLAREAGADHEAAFEQATKATYDGHFDYGAANRPRIMQGNVAKVLLLFKQYGQNMVYTLARNAQQSIKGESPEVRAQARKALGGLLAMHAAAAGVLGLPMVTTLLAAASMIGGDDDEPWDAKVALQNMLADTFGQKPAEVLAHGLSRLTPWDISGKVGLDRLIFPDVQEGLEGQRLGEAAMAAALGPVAGIGINVLKGLQDMSQGQYARGLESMMPAALRGPIKAIRYESEGVQDKTGVVIKDEVSLAGVAGQFLGFSPSEVRNATEGKSAIYQQDRALGERRQELLTKAARATMAKDAEARAEAMKEIERFNQKNPTRRITPLNVLQSVRNRQKRIDQAEGGVYLPKNRRDAMEAGRFAVAE